MGAGQREKQTEKQRANLPDFQGFPRLRPGLLDVDSQQPEEFCWGNTVIGQLANGLKKNADVDWKVLQWVDCSSGGGELLLSCKGQASLLYCGSEWDRVSGWGQVRPEKAESSSNCSSGPGEQGTLLELYKSDTSPKGI